MRLTRTTYHLRLLLFAGIFLALNLLLYRAYVRLDFTADRRYTLSPSTREIIRNLDQPVTITAYFSDNLPPQLATVGNDLRDLLAEYRSVSGGNVVFAFVDPTDDEEKEAEAARAGIATLEIRSREKDQIKFQTGYMGAIIQTGGQQEVIPQFPGTSGMEYLLSSNIRKLTRSDKPRVGFIQGHGEPGLDELLQVQQELTTLYEVDTLSLRADAWAACKTLVLLAPSEPIPADELAQLDRFLAGGGRLFIGLNTVNGDLQGQRPWDRVATGLDGWLSAKGVLVEQAFLIDQQSATLTMQRPVRQGPFVITQQIPIPFYFFPFIRDFVEHPVTQGLEQVLMQFASPITIVDSDSNLRITPLAYSSANTGKQAPPAFFNPEQQWTQADFANGRQVVAAAIEGRMGGASEAQIVLVSDGDFPLNAGGQPTLPDNVYLLANAIDWLTDDTGLIELRTRGVDARPLDKLVGDDQDVERDIFKVAIFLLPLVIVIAFGLLRSQRRKTRRLVWQAQDFS
ncbi:MAG: Gldg family protein [Bacteroidia bacterium]